MRVIWQRLAFVALGVAVTVLFLEIGSNPTPSGHDSEGQRSPSSRADSSTRELAPQPLRAETPSQLDGLADQRQEIDGPRDHPRDKMEEALFLMARMQENVIGTESQVVTARGLLERRRVQPMPGPEDIQEIERLLNPVRTELQSLEQMMRVAQPDAFKRAIKNGQYRKTVATARPGETSEDYYKGQERLMASIRSEYGIESKDFIVLSVTSAESGKALLFLTRATNSYYLELNDKRLELEQQGARILENQLKKIASRK